LIQLIPKEYVVSKQKAKLYHDNKYVHGQFGLVSVACDSQIAHTRYRLMLEHISRLNNQVSGTRVDNKDDHDTQSTCVKAMHGEVLRYHKKRNAYHRFEYVGEGKPKS